MFGPLGSLPLGGFPFDETPVTVATWPDYPFAPVSRQRKRIEEEMALIAWFLDDDL